MHSDISFLNGLLSPINKPNAFDDICLEEEQRFAPDIDFLFQFKLHSEKPKENLSDDEELTFTKSNHMQEQDFYSIDLFPAKKEQTNEEFSDMNYSVKTKETEKKADLISSTEKTEEKSVEEEKSENSKNKNKYYCSHKHCGCSFNSKKFFQSHHKKMSKECKIDTIEIIEMIRKTKNIIVNINKNNNSCVIRMDRHNNKYVKIKNEINHGDNLIAILGQKLF